MEDRLVKIHRVTKVVKGGRVFSYTSTSICGNRKYFIGFGRGKSREILESIKKSYLKARNNILKLNIFNNTISHFLYSKHSSCKIFLYPASKIIGLVACSAVKQVMISAGIKSIFSKIHGSTNSVNVTICAIKALTFLK